MKKVLIAAFLLIAMVSFAQEPQKNKKETRDTTKQTEEPVKITPQQMDVEPLEKPKVSKDDQTKKEIPAEGTKKEETKKK
ncbi:hypothetical protein [Flavobacterium sp. NKUCC04_CG]|uniref:hypothetical protein n=1 Tax=Flavobacterium sp. NKUCC04_CG TaxID=2842121 RepID=UPI001C5A60E0|nr:hypothetical protein [Flavobacterium sp. NKUCC04_CG]MBW3518867.1 hypothetical protein [Flavobacterium sp. NKUCC04_CG]